MFTTIFAMVVLGFGVNPAPNRARPQRCRMRPTLMSYLDRYGLRSVSQRPEASHPAESSFSEHGEEIDWRQLVTDGWCGGPATTGLVTKMRERRLLMQEMLSASEVRHFDARPQSSFTDEFGMLI